MSLEKVLLDYNGALSKNDIDFILSNYYTLSNNEMYEVLGEEKSNAINYFIKMLQKKDVIQLRGRGYKSKIGLSTQKIFDYIKKNYKDMTVDQMADNLKVTRNTILKKIRELAEDGLIDYHIRNSSVDYGPIFKYLRANYSKMSGKEISSELNVSIDIVYKAANVLRRRHQLQPKKTKKNIKS